MRSRVLAASAVFGTFLLTACGTATTPGSAYNGATTTVMSSMSPTVSASGMSSTGARSAAVLTVRKTPIGYVLAEANHQVVYTYSKDKKNGKPTCVGACAATWIPATGTPQAGPADVFPGQFGLVTGTGGVKQITYDGLPLYLLKDAKPLAVTGNGQGGVWHVVPLSASDIRT